MTTLMSLEQTLNQIQAIGLGFGIDINADPDLQVIRISNFTTIYWMERRGRPRAATVSWASSSINYTQINLEGHINECRCACAVMIYLGNIGLKKEV